MQDTGAPQEAPGKQTSPGQKDNPGLSAQLQARTAEKAQVQAESLGIAQRLSRRAKSETIHIPFSDDLGEFFVEVRLPTSAEMEGLMAFDKILGTAKGDAAEIAAATAKLCEQLANLTVDPSLDKDFFSGGNFLASDLSQIIKEIFLEEERRIKSVASFRKNAPRVRTV